LEIKNQVMLKKIINAIRVLFKSSSNKPSKRPHLQEEWNSKGNPFLILSISIPMILVVLIH